MNVTLRDTITVTGKIRPELGSSQVKTITLRIHIDHLTASQLEDIIGGKLKITWVNSHRNEFDKLTDGGTYDYKPYVKTATVREYTGPELVVEAYRRGFMSHDDAVSALEAIGTDEAMKAIETITD